MLLQRHDLTIPAALEHLLGLQAQAANPPFIGLWSRVQPFAFDDLNTLLLNRQVVRTALMRGTLHLVTARDVLRLRPILQPVLERNLLANHGRDLIGLDLDAVAALAREGLAHGPLSYAALGKKLQQRWPKHKAEALAMVARNREILVQAPPTLWGGGKVAQMTTAQNWLGKSPVAPSTAAEMLLRYLAAFGPASTADMRAWCGLTGITELLEGLMPRLRRFRSAAGVELFDLPDAPRPDAEMPAPVRLLAGFDNLLLSHADRSRFVAEEYRGRIATINGIFHPTVLIDGRVVGLWRLDIGKKAAVVEIAPFSKITPVQRRALTAEGVDLLRHAAPDADHDIRFTPVG
ncbi:MAG TPA: winged helix DNA-binding domain-containing protein [Dongiaceae bacterium]